MSKEMLVIALGVWVIVVRTLLGIPGEWQTALLVLSGLALAVTGFLLRGEAIGRAQMPRSVPPRRENYPFVENSAEHAPAHEHKEGITSLN